MRTVSPTTSLSLLPPGVEKIEEEEDVEVERAREEGKSERNDHEMVNGQTCLMKIMQRMIADEVRSYIDSLRLQP